METDQIARPEDAAVVVPDSTGDAPIAASSIDEAAPQLQQVEVTLVTQELPMEMEQDALPLDAAMVTDPIGDAPMEGNVIDEAGPEPQPPKIAREREDDDEASQPSAKRKKTEEADGPEKAAATTVPHENGTDDSEPSPSTKPAKIEEDDALEGDTATTVPHQNGYEDSQPPAESAKMEAANGSERGASTTSPHQNGDDDNQPLAERTKTEEADGSERGASTTTPHPNGDDARTSDALTDHEVKELQKVIRNSTKTLAGKNFRKSVADLWPELGASYAAKIENPVDLSLIDNRLRDRKYLNMQAFKSDINLLYNNCCTFNGADHGVSKQARELRDSIFEKARRLPPPTPAAPKREKSKAPKKPTPAPDMAPRANTARRQSKGSGQSPAQPVGPAATTFALNPNTQSPIIRRDSTKGDRPKREIHPPKTKDLPYSAAKPKNKKVATELRFCEHVLNEMKKPKHSAYSLPFLEPVDPVALNIPNYFTIIKNPMDLQTVTSNLRNGVYPSAKEFERDVRLIFANCFKFNPANNPVNEMGKRFLDVFNHEWEKKQSWVAEHSPPMASPSPQLDSDEEESEEEADQDESAPTAPFQSVAATRLIHEQSKLIALLRNKNADQSEINLQEQVIAMVKKAADEAAAAAKKPKKTKAPKPKKSSVAKTPKPVNKFKKLNQKKPKYMGTVEKEVISNGLSSLPDDISTHVLEMIKQDQMGVDVGDDGTLELDIDVVSAPILWKIHDLIMEYAPEVDATVRAQFAEKEAPRTLAKPAPKKKNKPMNAGEQEAKIEALKNKMGQFDRQGSGSQEPVLQSKSPGAMRFAAKVLSADTF
ncbi:putative Bromodomain-containing factor 1 [Glarea lozoyensis 74030]|uniref:Putative Bromodomain-containing factor 1 n=1 Tax=Glarea lozoyensis (strain ATCC 74030 / MF5533) TaxID=1104152 RepID=H0ESQ3_GLAL7|nr:putative Bromodomain-containing factor 1 [Glarea lozoyensis 74030]